MTMEQGRITTYELGKLAANIHNAHIQEAEAFLQKAKDNAFNVVLDGLAKSGVGVKPEDLKAALIDADKRGFIKK